MADWLSGRSLKQLITSHPLSRSRVMKACYAQVSFSVFTVLAPSRQWCPHNEWVFPPQHTIKIIIHGHAQRPISQAIIDSVKLTMATNYHSPQRPVWFSLLHSLHSLTKLPVFFLSVPKSIYFSLLFCCWSPSFTHRETGKFLKDHVAHSILPVVTPS